MNGAVTAGTPNLTPKGRRVIKDIVVALAEHTPEIHFQCMIHFPHLESYS
jgi:hypothetical protein